MYNQSAFFLLFFFIPSQAMNGSAHPQSSVSDHISLSMSKNLFDFFVLKLNGFKSVSHAIYDEAQQRAVCRFKYKRNTHGLLNDAMLVDLLNSNTMPNHKQRKQINLVLPAFEKLQQLMAVNFIMFNKLQTGVIMNPAFAIVSNSDLCTLFESMEQSARICAAVAEIPFLD